MPSNDHRLGGRRSSLLASSSARITSVIERQSEGYRYRLTWPGRNANSRNRKPVPRKGTVYVKRGRLGYATAASFILVGAATLTALPPGAPTRMNEAAVA